MLMMTLKRLLMAVPSLIGVVIVTFLLTRALPGDPAAYFAGPAATKEAVEQIRVQLGLDKPLYIQFVKYVADLAHGDLGNSLTTGQPVGHEIKTPASGVGRADAAWPDRLDADRGAARHHGGDTAELDHRSHLPDRIDSRCITSRVLHRTDPGLRVLLPPRLGARAARAVRRVLQPAAERHRILPDRQPDRRPGRNLHGGVEAAHPAGAHARHLLARADRTHDASLDARSTLVRFRAHRAREWTDALYRRRHLRISQRHAPRHYDARHGVLVPAGRQRAGRRCSRGRASARSPSRR